MATQMTKKKKPSTDNVILGTKEPTIDAQGQIIIPVAKDIGFSSQIKKILLGNFTNPLEASTKEVFSSFLDVEDLQKAGKGTSIPFLSTLYGNFLINPSSVSISTFQKMWQVDDTIHRCAELNVATIVDGLGEYYHHDKKIQEFVRYCLSIVNGGKDGLVRQILTSLWAGFWVGFIEDAKDKNGYTIIKNVRQLPQISIQFTATPQGDVDQIFQYVYNYPYAGTQNALSIVFNANMFTGGGGTDFNGTAYGQAGIDQQAGLGDMDYPFRTNFINTFGLIQLDKSRCMHFIYDRLNGKINPYGYSIERSNYTLWIEKALTRKLYDAALGRCANPMVVGYADATKVVNTPIGTMQINAVDALYNTLQHYTEESAIILPGKKGEMFDVQVVQNEGNFDVYDTKLKYLDAALEKGHFLPEGIFSSSSSYAGVTAQNSIYTRMMDSIKNETGDCILNQFVKFLIHENFDDEMTDLGRFENELQNIDDKLKYEKLFEGMTANGYLSNTAEKDIQSTRKTLGQPELDAKDLKELIERNKTMSLKSTADNTNRSNNKEVADHYKNRSTNENV